jgi:DNA mismatch repair protein MutS
MLETLSFTNFDRLKIKYPDAILLLRVNNIYITFREDAVKVAAITGNIKNSIFQSEQVPVSRFAFPMLDSVLPKLVKAGYRVAIAEKLETPSRETHKQKSLF